MQEAKEEEALQDKGDKDMNEGGEEAALTME